jgi:hypothetical protein
MAMLKNLASNRFRTEVYAWKVTIQHKCRNLTLGRLGFAAAKVADNRASP